MARNKRRAMEILEEQRTRSSAAAERAVLAACLLPDSRNDPRDPLGELRELAETAGARVVAEVTQNRRRPEAGTYIGTGKLDEILKIKDEVSANLVIFDNDLSPAQIRNIEEKLSCRAIDRSELILDIFASRATTTAARLQVELAQLEYTYPRLKSMWTHLGQITGGAPMGIGTRGPGETQIETDRRLVQARKTILKRRIAEVYERRVREVAERRREHFTVCVVGYTNAGKSTLFNRLTEPSGGGGAYADDRLFATLTTRTRLWPVGAGEQVMLSDTVGFVRDLPHHLIASFRATLEEAIHADLQLIVVDASDPQAELHYQIVLETLQGIEADSSVPSIARSSAPPGAQFPGEDQGPRVPASISGSHVPRRIVVLNKIDRLGERSALGPWVQSNDRVIPVSAVSGEGLPELAAAVQEIVRGEMTDVIVTAPLNAGRAIALMETRGVIRDREYNTDQVRYHLKIGSAHLPALRSLGCAVEDARVRKARGRRA